MLILLTWQNAFCDTLKWFSTGEELSLEVALALIRVARPAARPNAGFMLQLAHYEASQCRVESPEVDLNQAEGPATGGCDPVRDTECTFRGGLDSANGWGGTWRAHCDAAESSSPREVSAGPGFPFDDRAGVFGGFVGRGVACTPSPQSSRGGSTPNLGGDPTHNLTVPGFSLVTGFESPPRRL